MQISAKNHLHSFSPPVDITSKTKVNCLIWKKVIFQDKSGKVCSFCSKNISKQTLFFAIMHNQKEADTQLYNYQKQTYKKCLYPVNVLNFMNFYTNVTPLALTN